MSFEIRITRHALKQLEKCPHYIVRKFSDWRELILRLGIEETRKTSSFHDEPLQGRWFGFRSVRLNLKYRVIYRITTNDEIYIEIVEVTPHEYKK